MSKVGDYGAVVSTRSLLQMLEYEGCEHFKRLGSHGYKFPTYSDIPTPSRNVDAMSKLFVKEFWIKSGHEGAHKTTADHLAKVFFYL